MNARFLFLFAMLPLGSGLWAQQPPAPLPPSTAPTAQPAPSIRFSHAQRRASNSLSVVLNVDIQALPPGASLARLWITRATDNLGRDLPTLGPINAGARFGSNPVSRGQGRGNTRSVSAGVTLGAGDEKTTGIGVLEGTIEVYEPTTENGARVTLDEIGNRYGKMVEMPVLRETRIELTMLDPGKHQLPVPRGAPAPNAQRLLFLLRDPDDSVVGYHLIDRSGAPIPVQSSATRPVDRDGNLLVTIPEVPWQKVDVDRMIEIVGRDPLPKDVRLVIDVAAPGAIKSHSFRLENLRLP